MPYYTGVIVAAKSLLLSAGVVGLVSGGIVSAQAPDDNVEVMVCPDASQSSFTVSMPQSDSVTDQEKTVISGSVLLISQIDFFINDTYSHTVALGGRDVEFSSVMSLPPGTHTLKFVATDSCSNVTHTQTVVVTYEPAIQPSIGNEVPTRVGDQPNVDAVVGEDIVPPKSIAQEVMENFSISPIIIIGTALDITSLPEASSGQSWQNTSKSISFVFGSSLLLAAAYISLLGSIPSKLSLLPYSRSQLTGGLAIIGLVVLVFVFIL